MLFPLLTSFFFPSSLWIQNLDMRSHFQEIQSQIHSIYLLRFAYSFSWLWWVPLAHSSYLLITSCPQERGAEKEKKFVMELVQKQLEVERARLPKANPYPYTTDFPVVKKFTCIKFIYKHFVHVSVILSFYKCRFHQSQSLSNARDQNHFNWRVWSGMRRKCRGKWKSGGLRRRKRLRWENSRHGQFWKSKLNCCNTCIMLKWMNELKI